jgi:hypothetical protein
MLGLDVISGEHLRRKVGQIVGYDKLGSGTDRCGQNMPVIGIRQCQAVDQLLISRHKAVAKRLVHQAPGPGKAFR